MILAAAVAVFVASYLLMPFPMDAPLGKKAQCMLYFLLLTYASGYSLSGGLVFSKDQIELHLMRIGIGLGSFPLLFVILGSFGMPLIWWLPLAIACAPALYLVLFSAGKQGSASGWEIHSCLAILVSSLVFLLALAGSLAYPYLEDGDSWDHAVGAKYISLKHTYYNPPGIVVAHYLPPYPPTYDVLMGLIHQLNDQLQWTLKAYNALLVALTVAFSYFFVLRFSSSRQMALLVAVFLACVPAFGSHAIWSHTLAAASFYPLFYCIVSVRRFLQFRLISILLLASAMLIQPLMSMVIGVFFILYMLAQAISSRRETVQLFTMGVMGLAISMLYWLPALAQIASGSQSVDLSAVRLGQNPQASRYDSATLSMMAFPKMSGDIYMHEGYGVVFFGLVLVALAQIGSVAVRDAKSKRLQPWLLCALFWTLFSLAGLMAARLPLSVWPGRFWGIVPFGASILAAHAASWASSRLAGRYIGRTSLLILIVASVFITSGLPKIQAQTMEWPSDIGVLLDRNIQGYVNLIALPADTMVFSLCMGDRYVIGMDKMARPWDAKDIGFRNNLLDRKPEEMHSFLKAEGYGFMLFESYCIKKCAGGSRTLEGCLDDYSLLLRGIGSHPGFSRVYADPAVGMFRII
jgi:hypothetical protein